MTKFFQEKRNTSTDKSTLFKNKSQMLHINSVMKNTFDTSAFGGDEDTLQLLGKH